MTRPLDALMEARGILFPWVPVFMACGISLYFGWRDEPGPMVYLAAAVLAVFSLMVWRWGDERLHPLAIAVLSLSLGLGLAGARAHLVAEPVLGFRYYGPIEGRVIAIDRSLSDQVRVTLDRVVLERTSPDRTPERVRVSLHGSSAGFEPEPGMTLILTGHLSPPQGPVEPGGFDFQRMAWFDRLGAVGYTRSPVLLLSPPEGAELRLAKLRRRIAGAVTGAIAGEAGAFAAAVATGDRSALSRATTEDLRRSNLSHLLAISGLHMGLLSGFVYAAMRYGLSLIPPLALRIPVRKISALAALLAAAFYLALSGGNVATERAFVMVAVMFGAVLFDRRALTLRSVAIAAILILAIQPESLAEPGFQMSFAATTALVAGFGALQGWQGRHNVPRWLAPVLTLLFSSAIAGLATAPISAAHFNRVAEYGLLANMLTVPLMGLLVMPMAVLAVVLWPLGLAKLPLLAMGAGAEWILTVAHWVAGLEGAVLAVPKPPGAVLPVMALGALWLLLWRGPLRYGGVLAMAGALMLWSVADRPALLVAEDAGLVGVLGAQGRALSKPKGAGFAARSWLENDGDLALQPEAAGRLGFAGAKGDLRFDLAGMRGALLTGKSAGVKLPNACRSAGLVIVQSDLAADLASVPPPGCLVIDQTMLKATGPLAFYATPEGYEIVTTRLPGHERLWTRATGGRLSKAGAKSAAPPEAGLPGLLAMRDQ